MSLITHEGNGRTHKGERTHLQNNFGSFFNSRN
jgi:hypothetical protein